MGCQQSMQVVDTNEPELNAEQNTMKTTKKGDTIDRFQNRNAQGINELFEVEQETEEEFTATKPWLGAIIAPSNKPAFNPQPPSKKLKLSFINGFKVQDSRQNIFWGKTKDEIIYCAAAVGIVMNVGNLKQRYLGGTELKSLKAHNDDIMSLGVSPDRKTVVTGSLGANPMILVWDSDSMQVIAKTQLERNTRAVSSIRFSTDGQLFFCSDKHNDSNVYVFSADAKLLGKNQCGSDPIFDGEAGTGNVYGVATKGGAVFFEYKNGSLEKKKGLFGQFDMSAMITITFNPQENCFFTGTSKGQIYRWQNNQCVKTGSVHQGAVMGLHWAGKKLLSSGSKDNIIKISNSKLQQITSFAIPSYAKSLDLFNGQIVVGTKCGRILTFNENGSNKKQVMHGHSTGEAWGLAISSQGKVYSTADDNTILCFNPKSSKVEAQGIINQVAGKKYKIGGASSLSLLPPNQQSRAIAVNKAGHVIIGCNDGSISVRTTKDLNHEIYKDTISKEWIEVIKYSPDEKKVAVGSHDNNIYILSVSGDTYQNIGVLKAHNSFITNLDWSRDGKYIQSNCGAYELLFFDVEKFEQIKSGGTQLKDQKWSTYTVKIGWWVQGIFPKDTSGDHVNGVDRSKAEDVIVTADDYGLVNLYRNPALKGAKAISYKAHSSHVVRSLFDKQDQYIYSIGGEDKTLMMWKYE